MDNVNVETIVVQWLNANSGAGWSVYGDQPKTRPEKYILVDRTGGSRESRVLDKAEILIEVYHKESRLDASNKAQDLIDIIPQMVALEPVTRAQVNSLVKLDDLIGQYNRYQIYVDIYARRDIIDIPLEYPVIINPDHYDKNFTYAFTNQSTITVTHNLNKYPAVSVKDSAGTEVEGDVTYVDLNTVTIEFIGSFTGMAIFN